MSDDALPPLYADWLGEALPAPPAPEHRATCGDCVLCKPAVPEEERFRAETKCCTYVPRLPNFLVGRILADEDPAMARGKAILLDRLRRGIGVHPMGMVVDDREQIAYELLVEAGLFGQATDLKCPWFITDGGLCSIWRHRNATCSTWYCRHDQGARGHRFWQAVEGLLKHLEHTAALHLAVRTRFGRPRDRAHAEAAILRGEWDDWITDIEGYYRATADHLAALDWEALLRLDPTLTLPLVEAVQDAQFQRHTPPPSETRYTFAGTHRETSGQHRLSGYLRFAALSVSPDTAHLVTRWRDGTLAELAGALQSSLDTDDAAPQLLQRLIDDEILKPAP